MRRLTRFDWAALIVLPFQGEPAPSFRFPRAALRSALGFGVEAFQARRQQAYTLTVRAEPTALQRFRQPEAGSVMYHCQECNKVHHVPKACGNRHCPSCQGDKARNWLAQQQVRLLPCHYFMLTFTVPSQLRRFIRSHPKECYRALLEAAYQSMATLASDRRFMGLSNIGATGILHTWGRDMNYHPHVHFIVPGGAISKSGDQWLPSRTNYFVYV